MKLLFIGLSLITISALTGCANKPFVSQSQIQERAIINQYNDALAFAKECIDKYKDNPDFVTTYEEISVRGLNASNRTELMSSNKKLSTNQKRAFQNFIKLRDECSQGVLSRLNGSPFYSLFQSKDTSQGITEASLLSDKITIGEANVRKVETIQKMLNDIAVLQQQLSAQFAQSHGAEAAADANRRAAAAAAWAGGMQGMARSYGNTAQYFQNQNQQLMQQNQYRAPVNTNCQPNGVGGFNCTSR
jgi:hypothetical protein